VLSHVIAVFLAVHCTADFYLGLCLAMWLASVDSSIYYGRGLESMMTLSKKKAMQDSSSGSDVLKETLQRQTKRVT
jgi:hypothetical protein